MCTCCDHDGIIAILKQTRDVIDSGVQLKLDPLVQDALDLPIQQLIRETVCRDANPHHPARNRKRIKDRDNVPQAI